MTLSWEGSQGCYLFLPTPMTWQEASNQCFAFNSIMVEINSKAESEAINDQVTSNHADQLLQMVRPHPDALRQKAGV